MKIEVVTKFDTSHVGNHGTIIEVKILTDDGIEVCSGIDKDEWLDTASVKRATNTALCRMQHMLDNVTAVAKKAGLL